MSDPTPPEPPDPDERVGAWLDGELTEAQARAVAAEIEADPELAARVEAIREVRERLAGSETAEVPEGFAARVQQAVAAEAGAGQAGTGTSGSGEPASADATAAVSLDEARARRERRRRRLVAAGSVAAALIALAVITPVVSDLVSTPESTFSDDVAEEAGDTDDASEAVPEVAKDSGGASEEADLEAQDAESDDDQARSLASGGLPRVIDRQREFPDRAALLDHAADRPEAGRLLGTDPDRAAELADRTAAALRRAEPFDDGTHPAACLRPLIDAVDGPAVIARVERLAVDGRALTAHLVVSGRTGQPLETITLYGLDPRGDCAFRVTERLDGSR